MKKLSLLLVALTFLLASCKPEAEKPTVVTKSVGEVTETTAKVVGQVTADGGGEVTARGICWSTKHNPTLEDEYTIDGKGVGSFISDMEDLEADTKYYVRAYATNEKGTAYGEEVSFTTEEEDEPEEPGDEPEEPGDEPEEPGDEPEEPGDEPEEPGDFTTAKCVLLEDYIGVRCNNCPAAGEIALDIQKQYGHNVVVLGVHAGFLSQPFGGFPDFTTPEGTEWYSFFGFDCNPVGTVNRKLNGGQYVFYSPEWTDAVASVLQEEATVGMASNVEYDATTRNLKVDVTSKALVELPDTYSLTVCIMEDSIVGRQLLPTGNDDNYVHRYVFRKTLNGTWGEDINTTALAPEDQIMKSYSVTLDEAYNADQCYVIAYVTNTDTKEVLQVIEKKIK